MFNEIYLALSFDKASAMVYDVVTKMSGCRAYNNSD